MMKLTLPKKTCLFLHNSKPHCKTTLQFCGKNPSGTSTFDSLASYGDFCDHSVDKLSIAAAGGAQSPPIVTPAFHVFISRLTFSIRQGLSQRRPWYELIDRTAMACPDNLTEAYCWLHKNLSYFKVNYITLLAVVLTFSLLSHPFSLLVLLGLLATWVFLYPFQPSDQPLLILGHTFFDRETLGALVVLTVFVMFLTSVGLLLISALLIEVTIICIHGAFRVLEDLFLDEEEPPNSRFLSFLGSAASSATAAAAPTVVSRVRTIDLSSCACV